MRRILPIVLFAAACTPRTEPAAPEPARVQPMPLPVAAVPPPVPVVEQDRPTDLRAIAEGDGVRVEFAVALPPLPTSARNRLTRAVTGGLLAGLDLPRGELQAQANALHQSLVRERAGAGAPWHVVRRADVVWQGQALLCLRLTIAEEIGGSAENVAASSLVVETAKLRALTLDELVPPAAQATLADLLLHRLRNQRGLAEDAPLSRHGFLVDRPVPPMPFIDAEGLRFVWNAGDIAPRGEGAFTVSLRREEIAGYLACAPWPSGK